MNPRDLIGEALRSQRTEESENYPVTLPASPAPHPQSGANGPAPPWIPDRKYVKLKYPRHTLSFTALMATPPGNFSATFGFLSLQGWKQGPVLGAAVWGPHPTRGGSLGPHHTGKAAEVRNGGGVWGWDNSFSDCLQGGMRCYWPP